MRTFRRRGASVGALALTAVLSLTLAACGGEDSPTPAAPAAAPAATVDAHAGHHASTATPAPIALRPGERFQTLGMANPYTPAPPAAGTDDYRCFIVDPGITRTTFMTGFQFLPQNAAVVHHAIFFKLEKKDVAEAKALDAKEPGDGYTCFAGTGIGSQGAQLRGAPWLAAWAPGGSESLTAAGTGYQLDPGTQVIMQVHYNLLATNGKATGTDQSGIRLRLTDAKDLEALHTTLLVAPVELPCTSAEAGRLCDRDLAVWDVQRRFGDKAGYQVAGLNFLCNDGKAPKPGNTQVCDRTMNQKMVVHAVAGHMHLLGRSISVTQNPGVEGARKLLDVPVYNFDDQGARRLSKAAVVEPGDTLRVSCTWDAGLRAQLPALKTLRPRYVVWGEGTSDEMCLGVVIWSAK